MFGALAQILPDRVPAAGEGGNTVVCIGGYRKDHTPFIIVDMICGAWGARPNKDGIEGITNPSQNLSNTPVEVLEAQHPVRIEEYGFVPNSGGAGRWRGGLGIRRSYRLLSDEAFLQLRADRVKFQPYGLSGGHPGHATRNLFVSAGANETTAKILPSKVSFMVKAGDLLIHEQAGGGGFGHPSERQLELVAQDVSEEKVTVEEAYASYGVVIGQSNGLD